MTESLGKVSLHLFEFVCMIQLYMHGCKLMFGFIRQLLVAYGIYFFFLSSQFETSIQI